MSATLLGLAFRAEAPSQSAKLVLLKLVDCCDDEGRKIFPSVAMLARAALCSTRNVQRVLKEFCAVGLLRRVKEGGSGPRSTSSYEMNLDVLYRLGREGGWEAVASATRVADEDDDDGDEAEGEAETAASHDEGAYLDEDETGGSATNKGDTVSPLDAGRMTLATNKGDKLCHPTPQEEPLNQRERVRASAEETGRQGDTESHALPEWHAADAGQPGEPVGVPVLAEFLKAWPNVAVDDQARIENAWAALPFDQRRAAIDGIKPFLALLAADKKTHRPAGWKYLGERRWALLGEMKAERQAEEFVTLKAWSRDWWIVLFRDIWQGKPVGFTVKRAGDGHGISIRLRDKPSAAEIAAVSDYLCDGPEMAAWRGWFAARRIWLPNFKGEFRVFLPGPAPPGQRAPIMDEAAKAGFG